MIYSIWLVFWFIEVPYGIVSWKENSNINTKIMPAIYECFKQLRTKYYIISILGIKTLMNTTICVVKTKTTTQ